MHALGEDVRPRMVEGLPECDDACPNHDGKRCRATGFRPDRFCEPALDRLVADRNLLRNQVPGLTATLDELRGTLLDVLASAVPHPVHNPTMWSAWYRAERLLGIPESKSQRIMTSDKALKERLTAEPTHRVGEVER